MTTYVHRIVLMEFRNLLDLAHHHDQGRSAVKQTILGSEVVLPCCYKVRDALLEELAINLDLRHRDEMREDGREIVAKDKGA